MCDPNKPLSDKHKAFVDFYLQNGRNASKAYKAVYQSQNEESVRRLASKLLTKLDKHPYFVDKCAELEENCGVSFNWAVEMNKKILEDALRGDEIPTENGSYIKKDRRSALTALKQITDLFGWEEEKKLKLKLEGNSESGAIEIAHVKLD